MANDENVLLLFNDNSSVSVPGNATHDIQELISVNYIELSFYVCLFTIGGAANFFAIYNLAQKKRYNQTRHETLLLNLAIADAIVTLLMTPTEIAWRLTASWKAGNTMCKIFQFYRLFGIYLSSMILICISVDRLLAVYSPYRYQSYDIFMKKLLTFAWILSAIFSLPQIFVFHVESPVEYPGFTQCVSFNTFETDAQLRLYNIFCISIIYFVPLLCISLCYTFICIKIRRKMVARFLTVFRNGDLTTVVNQESQHSEAVVPNDSLRCSHRTVSYVRRRQEMGTKIVKDTVIIIAAFIICWTPYATIHLWYQIDWSSAFQVDKNLQGILFLFAISNSCVNPYIYARHCNSIKIGKRREK